MRQNKVLSMSLLLLLWLLVSGVQAQSGSLSAVVNVIADGVFLQRAGTVLELPLNVGSVAPLGAGDRIRTADNGRVLITFPEANRLLLLPDSAYTLDDFTRLAGGQFHLEADLKGIAIQQFTDNPADWQYTLNTAAFKVTAPSQHFAVWAVANRLEAAISAQGTLGIQTAADTLSIPPNAGIYPPYSNEAISLTAPFHASQLLSLSINCQGIVSTGGSEGLRLRAGAALDYQVLNALRDREAVYIVGTTENTLWYRIPYQTGFGWLYSSLVEADCQRLPQFPNLAGEANEQIKQITEPEIELLMPFYGTPRTNPVFYR